MYEVKDTNQAERAARVRCAVAFLQSQYVQQVSTHVCRETLSIQTETM